MSDLEVQGLMKLYDDTVMPLPEIGDEPQLLISKVRKYYLDYIIKLLSTNYENNQKLLGKNIYLPSAIWRCAKYIEMNAVQSCMVAELYRNNVVKVIKELKTDTKKGKLNKELFKQLKRRPNNEKKIQVDLEKPKNCTCQCDSEEVGNKRKRSNSPKKIFIPDNIQYKIPTIVNSTFNIPTNLEVANETLTQETHVTSIQSSQVTSAPRLSVDSQDTVDLVMLQMKQMFSCEGNETEDDLFEGMLCDSIIDSTTDVMATSKIVLEEPANVTGSNQDQAAIIKSLDERLALLESTGLMNAKQPNSLVELTGVDTKVKKARQTKWLCESYFQKLFFYEKMDEIRDNNWKKHARIKRKCIYLFGEDSEEGIMSPLEETREFMLSCKERVAPWIVKLLTPYYVKGRIKGKALFKALAKHMIELIYKCSRYPSEQDVYSFITDFLKNHTMIRREADFLKFRIENI